MTIYFLSYEESDLIKIGYTSTTVEKRVATLQTGLPHRLIVLAHMDGSMSEEAALHRQFAEHRVNGEWFKPSPGLMELIERHKVPEPEIEEPVDEPPLNGITVRLKIDAPYDPEAGDVPWSQLSGKFPDNKPADWLEKSRFFDWRHIVRNGQLPTKTRHFE